MCVCVCVCVCMCISTAPDVCVPVLEITCAYANENIYICSCVKLSWNQ